MSESFFASVDHAILMQLLKRKIKDTPTTNLLENIIGSFSGIDERGIPLGNLTSQLFANVYLHELDHFVKMALSEKYYLRYCDDFILLGETRSDLLALADQINAFLADALLLHLHPQKCFVRTWGQGIDFLGYVLLPYATVMRTKTVHRMLKRVDVNNIASYLGLCSHADAFELERVIKTIIA